MIKCPERIYLSEERFALAHSSTHPVHHSREVQTTGFWGSSTDYAGDQRRTVNPNSCWVFLCYLCSSASQANCPAHNEYIFPPQSAQWGHYPIHKPRSPSPRWVLDSVNLTATTITLLTLSSWLDSMDISDGDLIKISTICFCKKTIFYHPS